MFVSWRGATEALVLLLAIFAAWFYTSWAATMIPAQQPRTLWMVLAVMLLGLFMNASVTGAFANSGSAFVVPFLLIQLGRTGRVSQARRYLTDDDGERAQTASGSSCPRTRADSNSSVLFGGWICCERAGHCCDRQWHCGNRQTVCGNRRIQCGDRLIVCE